MVLRIGEEVVNHLNRFRVLNLNMLLFAHGLHEVLMDKFSDLTPCFAIVHDQEMVSLSDQVGNYRRRAIAVYVAFLIHEALDKFAVRNDEGRIREPLQAKDASELSSPFFQSVVVRQHCAAPVRTSSITGNARPPLESGARFPRQEAWAVLFSIGLRFSFNLQVACHALVNLPGGNFLVRFPMLRIECSP